MKNKSLISENSLENLLDSVGVFEMPNVFWVKIEAHKVSPNEHIPQGVRYSLTLHNPTNVRIIGYDNAHAIKPKKSYSSGKKITWDHKHYKTKILPYEYQTADKLQEDFWTDVNRLLDEIESGS